MPEDIPLRPATREEIEYTLSYGLRFGTTGKAHRLASEATARIAAQVLINHLEQSGFVLMKKPAARSTTPLAPDGSKHLTE
jgi:hypothetical protein